MSYVIVGEDGRYLAGSDDLDVYDLAEIAESEDAVWLHGLLLFGPHDIEKNVKSRLAELEENHE